MFKIGFVGNSCTGKTTAAFSLIKLLKMKRCLTAYCTDACRFVTFDPQLFDTDPNTRIHVLMKQIANETEQMVRRDADYLITERTVWDWYLYYRWTCGKADQAVGDKNILARIEALVLEWMNTYDLLFLMDSRSMVYVEDGFRPKSTSIREDIENEYKSTLNVFPHWFPGKIGIVQGSDLEQRNDAVERTFNEWLQLPGHLIVRPSRIPG